MEDRADTEIKLQSPIQHGQEQIDVLKMRKPRAKDLRPLPAQPNFGDLLNLAATLCNQPASVMDKLDVADALAVTEAVGAFFPDSRATGG